MPITTRGSSATIWLTQALRIGAYAGYQDILVHHEPFKLTHSRTAERTRAYLNGLARMRALGGLQLTYIGVGHILPMFVREVDTQLQPQWVFLWREPVAWARSVMNRKIRMGKLVATADAIDTCMHDIIDERLRVLRILGKLGRTVQHWHMDAYTQPDKLAQLLASNGLTLKITDAMVARVNDGAAGGTMLELPHTAQQYIEHAYATQSLLRDGYATARANCTGTN